MPPSLPAGWTVTKRSNHSGAYQQLDAIGVTLGFPPRGAAALEFSVNGAACSLALSVDSGTVTGLDLSIKAEGLSLASGPLISLRPETAFDRTGKQRGIAREVQLGDEGFDAAVSVDSNATDAEVKRVLPAPGLRAAVQSLLRSDAEDLRLDSTGVRAHWKKSSECFLPERVLPVLELLLLVHRAGRPRGKVLATPGEGLQRLLIAMLMANGVAFFLANSRWDAPLSLLLSGGFLGLVASFFWEDRSAETFHGESKSWRVGNRAQKTVHQGLLGVEWSWGLERPDARR